MISQQCKLHRGGIFVWIITQCLEQWLVYSRCSIERKKENKEGQEGEEEEGKKAGIGRVKEKE